MLLELVFCGKQVLIVTNSSKTRLRNIARLESSFGLIVGKHYHDLVSSAQLIRDWLADRIDSVSGVHMICAKEDASLIEDLDIEVVPIRECEFVLLLSLPTKSGDDRWLRQLEHAGKTVLVPNADAGPATPAGLVLGLGPAVKKLQTAGVDVRNFGKPNRTFYEICDRYWLHSPRNVLAVGDQLLTDVVGASSFGWATALVLTGLGGCARDGSAGIRPDLVLPSLRL